MILTYITHDTPDEQRTIDDVQSVLIDTTAPLSSFKMGNPGLSGVGAADMHDTLSRNTSILVVETKSPAKAKEEKRHEQGEKPVENDNLLEEGRIPYPYVLLSLSTLFKENFTDESEACSKLNRMSEEGEKVALFEYSEKRETYILLNYSLV